MQGRYRIGRRLASGGTSDVFMGQRLDRLAGASPVAIKCLHPHLARDDRIREAFETEARLLASFTHPGIPRYLDHGELDGRPSIAMGLVSGVSLKTLNQWPGVGPPGPPLQVRLRLGVGVVLQACEALHHVHECVDAEGRPVCLAHQDVTSHNLLVGDEGAVSLLDFGIAALPAIGSYPGDNALEPRAAGTRGYMAPEQVLGGPVDRRVDIFGLGVVLYETVTGSSPFPADPVRALTAVVDQDVPRPSERCPGFPAGLEAVVLQSLARDRSARFDTALTFAAALRRWADTSALAVDARDLQNAIGLIRSKS